MPWMQKESDGRMSGLERLRKFIEANPALLSYERNEIRSIADEIERDMKKSIAWKRLGEYVNGIIDGKYTYEDSSIYRRYSGEPFGEWLDRWYLPRPVIDGEPVQFGDMFEVMIGDNLKSRPVSGFYIFNDRPNQLFIETSKYCEYTPYVEDAKRVKPDSIEKLKTDMLYVLEDDSNIIDEIVDEWLSRAEKLFKGGYE